MHMAPDSIPTLQKQNIYIYILFHQFLVLLSSVFSNKYTNLFKNMCSLYRILCRHRVTLSHVIALGSSVTSLFPVICCVLQVNQEGLLITCKWCQNAVACAFNKVPVSSLPPILHQALQMIDNVFFSRTGKYIVKSKTRKGRIGGSETKKFF